MENSKNWAQLGPPFCLFCSEAVLLSQEYPLTRVWAK